MLLYNLLNGHKLLVMSHHRAVVALLSHTSQVPQMTRAALDITVYVIVEAISNADNLTINVNGDFQ